MYKILNLNMYPSLKASLNLSVPVHPYPTRNRLDYNLQFPRVESIRMNYRYQFIKTWNELPPEIKDKPTLLSFKRALTANFIDTY